MKEVKDLKVGDTAFDVRYGVVEVIRVEAVTGYSDYPIMVKLQNGETLSYTIGGKAYATHTYPLLFTSKPFAANQGKWMMVSDDHIDWKKRFVILKKNGMVYAWDYAETDEELNYTTSINPWKYTKEVEEVMEYTMNELVAILGHTFKIKE